MIGPLATLFQRVTQGVYVVGVAHGEVRNAFTAAWVMQVSFEPLLLALSINPHHSSYRLLKEAGAFSINVLKKGQLDLAAHYGRPAHPDKLAGTEWTTDRLGLPLLPEPLPGSSVESCANNPRQPPAGAGKVSSGKFLGRVV
jgi:flavin reductase (DIM6/NTAB) family NADH-FMN oxidoreductase RutF